MYYNNKSSQKKAIIYNALGLTTEYIKTKLPLLTFCNHLFPSG